MPCPPRFPVLVAALLCAGLVAPVRAADISNSVVAVVNGFPISEYDLSQRVGLYTVLSGMPATPGIRTQVLKYMEDEVLEMQEAVRRRITSVPKNDVDSAINNLTAASHLTQEQILSGLSQAGVKPEVLGNQVTAQLIWRRLVAERFSNGMPMTDDQLKESMDLYLNELQRNSIVEAR
jgi:peptidyl-prolyl cis-trans isomerase SurA